MVLLELGRKREEEAEWQGSASSWSKCEFLILRHSIFLRNNTHIVYYVRSATLLNCKAQHSETSFSVISKSTLIQPPTHLITPRMSSSFNQSFIFKILNVEIHFSGYNFCFFQFSFFHQSQSVFSLAPGPSSHPHSPRPPWSGLSHPSAKSEPCV